VGLFLREGRGGRLGRKRRDLKKEGRGGQRREENGKGGDGIGRERKRG